MCDFYFCMLFFKANKQEQKLGSQEVKSQASLLTRKKKKKKKKARKNAMLSVSSLHSPLGHLSPWTYTLECLGLLGTLYWLNCLAQ